MNKISILLAVVVSLLVWFVAHWILHWPHPLAPVLEIVLILAGCLVTLLILYAAKSITEGRPSGFLAQLLIMFVVGFGVAYIVINAAPPPPLAPIVAPAVVDCNLINDKYKVVFPTPIPAEVGWDVEWHLYAKEFRTNIRIDSFKQVDCITKLDIVGSTKKPFTVSRFEEDATQLHVGRFYKKIPNARVVQYGCYKFTVTCKRFGGNPISADPMIEIPRP